MSKATFTPLAGGKVRCSLCEGPKGIIKRARISSHRNSHREPISSKPKKVEANARSTQSAQPREHVRTVSVVNEAPTMLRARIDKFGYVTCPYCDRSQYAGFASTVRCLSFDCRLGFQAYQ